MDRRKFLKVTGVGAGTIALPITGQAIAAEALLKPANSAAQQMLADAALKAAKAAGATYADVRIGRYLNQFVVTRELKVQNIVNTESVGVGVRVIAKDTWGFAATSSLTPEAVAEAAQNAVAIAKANAVYQTEPVKLAPVKGVGEVSWRTPIKQNGMEIPIADKVDMLMAVNEAALENGADYVNSTLYLVNEQKYFASTDGSYIDQDVHRIWAPMGVTAVDKETGKFRSRNGLSDPMGMGWEYFSGDKSEKIPGVTTRYRYAYDMVEDATLAAQQARQKLTAPSVKPGKYSLVLDPTHLMLTIHESVGHPLELDRVLGYEANYAGTSFATLDKWESGEFEYGSKIVNLFADKIQPHSLGAVG
ncbi:MAG: TldD/PmbA family protein, partial [Pseudomonadota bacterium]